MYFNNYNIVLFQHGIRPQSNSGVLLEDAENGQNVPIPANYKTPTQQQQMESSRKLSNRITSGPIKRRTSLPGTPE